MCRILRPATSSLTQVHSVEKASDTPPEESSVCSNPAVWNIIREFATTEMTIPQVEKQLTDLLGNQYNDKDWRPAIDAVNNAEGDVTATLEAVKELASTSHLPRLTIRIPARPNQVPTPQLQSVEADLMNAVQELKKRNRIYGEPLTLEELVNPIEETQDGDSPKEFDGDAEIVAEVKHQMAVERGEIIDVADDDDEDDEEDDDKDLPVSTAEILQLCKQVERLCFKHGAGESSSELPKHLRRFRAHLLHAELKNAKQTTLDRFFVK